MKTQHDQIYALGRDAYQDGLSPRDNPHPPLTNDAGAWDAGFRETARGERTEALLERLRETLDRIHLEAKMGFAEPRTKERLDFLLREIARRR